MRAADEVAARKAALRAVMLGKLRALGPKDRTDRSEKIREQILASEPWQKAEGVLLFSSMRTEPDIEPLGAAAKESGKVVGIIPTTLRHEAELELPFVPELVLVPGLAFSRDRHRMGRGGGFYDRLLAGRAGNAFKLGVCFAFQLHDTIPVEPHDTLMDMVISA